MNHDPHEKIIRFPDRSRHRNPRNNNVKFFNFARIPDFVRYLVLAMLVVNVPMFLLADAQTLDFIYGNFGLIPAQWTGYATASFLMLVTPITHVILHGIWAHLGMNAIMALAFGTLCENAMGTRRCALIFVLSALAGAALYVLLNVAALYPLIGASGGLSGWFGAALVIMQGQGRFGIGQRSPWRMIIFWAAFMTLLALLMGDMIAWQAHLGGFLAGAAVTMRMRRRI